MATVALTTAGGALGGPVGAAVGSILGWQVDRAVLPGARRGQGPRLSELAVQTSSYGSQMPRLFGTIRVAGTVIWATDLREHRATSGGKGQPQTTRYTYTASFAVLLSARAVRGVRRIWAEGKLLRGAGGDWKARTGFRLHLGSESQPADPLIASAQGLARTPAHRGCAYAVFEDLDLADFGNRIPSLTFEVEADVGPVRVGDIAAEASGGGIVAEAGTVTVIGCSVHGDSARTVAEALVEPTGGWFADIGAHVTVRTGSDATRLIEAGAVVRNEGSGPGNRRSIASPDTVPDTLAVAYYDRDRDYQTATQRATRIGDATRIRHVDLPVVLDAAQAAALATGMIDRSDLARERRSVMLDWSAIDMRVGDRVAFPRERGQWRVTATTFEAMTVRLDLRRIGPATMVAPGAPGEAVTAFDAPAGTTLIDVIELPYPLDEALIRPRIAVAAAGTGAGWRQAMLLVGDGTAWHPAGTTAAPAVLGTVIQPPAEGATTVEDHRNEIVVALEHADMMLTSAGAPALDRGANTAMVGAEVVQFGRAERIDATRWRLSTLWRGRRGTEDAVTKHVSGERFVLLANDTLVAPDTTEAIVGTPLMVRAVGLNGDETIATAIPTGRAIVPPRPVHLSVVTDVSGDLSLAWIRRSRTGWAGRDLVDVPLSEEREAYRITMVDSTGTIRESETSTASIRVDARSLVRPLRVEVRQIGTFGMSAPAVSVVETGDE